VSLLGFILVLATIGYAMVQLRSLERQRASLQHEVRDLHTAADQYRTDLANAKVDLEKARGDLARARASLGAARSAIGEFHAGRLEDAVKLYDDALAFDPNDAYLQNLRAYSLFRLGRIDAALEGQRRSIAIDPNYAWGYFDLARFLCAATPPRVAEARQAALKAIDLDHAMKQRMESDGEFQRVCKHSVP
jgi:tetratricopeptide (TPR) repeat protein